MRTGIKIYDTIMVDNLSVTIHPRVHDLCMHGIDLPLWNGIWDKCGSLVEDQMWDFQDENK
jgi:hypothetical protein